MYSRLAAAWSVGGWCGLPGAWREWQAAHLVEARLRHTEAIVWHLIEANVWHLVEARFITPLRRILHLAWTLRQNRDVTLGDRLVGDVIWFRHLLELGSRAPRWLQINVAL